jgi:hypothetical protein
MVWFLTGTVYYLQLSVHIVNNTSIYLFNPNSNPNDPTCTRCVRKKYHSIENWNTVIVDLDFFMVLNFMKIFCCVDQHSYKFEECSLTHRTKISSLRFIFLNFPTLLFNTAAKWKWENENQCLISLNFLNLQSARQQLSELQLENATLKAEALNRSHKDKGNSLFGEVHGTYIIIYDTDISKWMSQQ